MFYSISEKEIHTLTKELQEEAKSMKMPMVRWAKGYHVKLDDVYTEPDLQIVDNQPHGPVFTAVSDYKTLFDNDNEGICNEENLDSNKNSSSNSACNDLVRDNKMNSEGHCRRSSDDTSAKQAGLKKVKPSKILLKADPGNGKTTFTNKVFLDWARGILAVFLIVFFVSMKLVKPGDVVENVIISQSPTLRRLKISKPKLQTILERFGASILIILDGMDQHDLQEGPHFLDLIEGAKYSCSILVTSRPHNVAEIEPHFETVVQLRGFTQSNAERYISKILKIKQKAETLTRFVSGPNFNRTYKVRSPMILLFLCVLVNNDKNVDIDNRSDNLGEIYTRLIFSVYRAYCHEAKIPFEKKKLERLLLSLGKLASEMQTHVSVGYYEKEALIHEVGKEAFDSGLLIGHEDDYRLLTLEAEIAVTFPHELIGSIFNAFFCTRVLGDWEAISRFKFPESWENIDEFSLYYSVIADHAFIRFFLWFVSDRCSAKYFQFSNRGKAFDQLALKVSKFFDHVQLDFAQISSVLPVLDVMQPNLNKDLSLLNLLGQALSNCKNIRELYMGHMCPVDWILRSIGCLLSLKLIVNTGVVDISRYEKLISTNILNDDDHSLVIIESAGNPLNLIPHLVRFAPRRITLCVTGKGCLKPLDVTCYFSKYISRLQLTDFYCASFGLHELLQCPLLSAITFTNIVVDRSVLDASGTSMKDNKLPVISILKFEDCGSSLEGNLKLLFKSSWRALEYLELYKCELDQSDVLFIAAENGLVPNLTTLRFGFSIRSSEMVNRRTCCRKEHIIDDNIFLIFRQHWPRLTTLYLHDVCKRQYKRIAPNLNAEFLPNLSDLAIYMWQDAPMWRKKQVQTQPCAKRQKDQLAFWEQLDMIDKMPRIKHHRLRHLTLQRFVCAPTHLHVVALSALSCRLDKLDVSHSSYVTGCLFILVGHSFPSPHTLILSDCQLNSRDLRSLATACTKGRLPELTMLDVSQNSNLSGCLNLLLGCALQSLKNLILVDCGLQTCNLKHLAMAKSEERLPELRYLDISNNVQISGELEHLFYCGQNWSALLTLKSKQKHAFGNDFEVLIAKN